MDNTIPKYLVKYWIKERKDFGPPTIKHSVFYEEDTMIKELPNIRGNYFIFCVGEPYKSKEYFDKMFAEEAAAKERQKYLELKQRYEG